MSVDWNQCFAGLKGPDEVGRKRGRPDCQCESSSGWRALTRSKKGGKEWNDATRWREVGKANYEECPERKKEKEREVLSKERMK